MDETGWFLVNPSAIRVDNTKGIRIVLILFTITVLAGNIIISPDTESPSRLINKVKDFPDEDETFAMALLVATVLIGCAAQSSTPAAPEAVKEPTTAASTDVVKRDLADGLYEMALSPAGDALYVASSEGFKDVQGGLQT